MLVVQSLPPSGNQILWKWGHQDPCHWVRLFTWVPIYMTFPTMSIRTIKCHFLFAMCTVNRWWPISQFHIFSKETILQLFCFPHIDWHTWCATLHWHRYTGKHTSNVRVPLPLTVFLSDLLDTNKALWPMKKVLRQGKVLLLKRLASIKDAKVSGWETMTRIFYVVGLKQIPALRSVLPFPPCLYPNICYFSLSNMCPVYSMTITPISYVVVLI